MSKQECISVGCVPTAAVVATRCYYQRGGQNPSPLDADPTPWRQNPPRQKPPFPEGRMTDRRF